MRRCKTVLDDADIVVVTAGSSVSYRDLTANAINKLGRPGVLVHGVAIRPGNRRSCGVRRQAGLRTAGKPGFVHQHLPSLRDPTIRLLLGAPTTPTRTVQARLGA